jgi:deoxyribodipyrimidine photo-lyase
VNAVDEIKSSMKNLIWFRNNLRIKDNHSLVEACKNNADVIAVYFFDPRLFQKNEFGFIRTGVYRSQFLIETIKDLKVQLEKINIPLLVFFERPEVSIPKVVVQYKIENIYLQKEWTRDEISVNQSIQKQLDAIISWNESYDQFLFHPDDVPYDDFKKIPRVFTEFRKKCEKYAQVSSIISEPEIVQENKFSLSIKDSASIPSLEELGHESFSKDEKTAFPFSGGASSGLKRIHQYIWESHNIANYKKTRNGLIGTAYSSKFSAWLANGSISAKQVYWEVKKYEKEVQKNQDTYWMIFELIWRDFFKYVSLKHGDSLFQIDGILNNEYHWEASEEKKEQWISGKTKYAFVNANMKEIAATGWMSNRGRQNVASFWAKELQQDWRIGASYFESMLIDYDVHSNWGNWQYLAGVGNDPRDRKFNIERQAAVYDPDKEFVDLWL